jgi:8-oxo-dGTP pyrophosphatase MutT (NUDIX family)
VNGRRLRPSARILLLDPQERVLLFHFVHAIGPLAGQRFWATPGGGLQPGEDFAQAARRELAEETGLVAAIGAEVHRRSTVFMMPDGSEVEADERSFLVRSPTCDIRPDNPDPVEASVIAEASCWSLAALAASDETVFPEDLAAILARLSPHCSPSLMPGS